VVEVKIPKPPAPAQKADADEGATAKQD